MIIVNTTFVLHGSVATEALEWVDRAYVASALHAGALPDRTLLTEILGKDSGEETSYALHVAFDSVERASAWAEGVGASLRSRASARWGDKALAFHTYLKVL